MRLLSTRVIVCLALLTSSVAAEVPPAHQAMLLLRTLAYDRSLKARAGPLVTIAVIYKEGDESSEAAQLDMTSVLREAALHLQVAGLPVRVISLPFRNRARLAAAFVAERVSAVYVCDGLGDDLGAISTATRRYGVLSIAGSEAYVGDGVAVGFVEREGRVVLLVDLDSVRAEGAQLEASLLRFAQLVKGRKSQ